MKRFGLIFTVILLGISLSSCSTFNTHNSTSTKSTNPTNSPTGQYALLVPLHGPFANAGKAVRDGFFAAYFQNKATGGVHVYDTTTGSVTDLYQQAQKEGASYIVGPLDKPNVQNLLKVGTFPVTTIALNYTDGSLPPNFYEFALSPEDEAVCVANKAYQSGTRRILIISPGGAWEQKIENSFTQVWQQLGGQTVGTMKLGAPQDIMDEVQAMLQRQQIGPKQFRFDAIFLITSKPAQARTVVPLLRMNGVFAPIYATSTVYSGMPTEKDKDLNGVRFCDIPWVINKSTNYDQLRNSLSQLWQGSGATIRLYAFGIDAYQLTQKLPHLNNYSGVTGTLSLDSQQRIRRALPWAEFQNGVVVPLN